MVKQFALFANIHQTFGLYKYAWKAYFKYIKKRFIYKKFCHLGCNSAFHRGSVLGIHSTEVFRIFNAQLKECGLFWRFIALINQSLRKTQEIHGISAGPLDRSEFHSLDERKGY